MRRAGLLREFLERPTRAYLPLGSLAYWCFDATLWGLTGWGSPAMRDVTDLIETVREEIALEFPPYASLIDFPHVAHVDPPAFAAWETHMRDHRAQQHRRLLHEALVRPESGLVASILAGYRDTLAPLHPFSISTHLRDALQSLGRPDAAEIEVELEALVSTCMHGPSVLERLRTFISSDSEELTIESAAAHLGLSERSLRRQLQSAGTTFHAETTGARARAKGTTVVA